MRIAMMLVASILLLAPPQLAAQQPALTNPEFSLEQTLLANGYQVVTLTKLRTGHETIEVTLNGVRGIFVLDSGAGASVVHSANREKFGLAETGASVTGTGAGGQISLQTVPIQSLSLGAVAVPQPEISVTDLGYVVTALQQAAGVTIDGVIGQDILTRDGGIIDVRSQRLFLLVGAGSS